MANVGTVWARAEDSGHDEALREVSLYPAPPRPAPLAEPRSNIAAGSRQPGVLKSHG